MDRPNWKWPDALLYIFIYVNREVVEVEFVYMKARISVHAGLHNMQYIENTYCVLILYTDPL